MFDLTEEEFNELFKKMKSTLLDSKLQKFHSDRLSIANSDYTYDNSSSLIPVENNSDLILDWGKIAIDELYNKLQFDGFLNDSFGATRFLYENGGYPVIHSAIRNSEIGACAFVSIIPGNVDDGEPIIVFTPYAGYEATGIYNVRTTELEYGLAVTLWDDQSYVNAKPLEYKMFGEGWVAILDADGKVKYDGIEPLIVEFSLKRCLLIPAVYDPDPATKPFGHSRISKAGISSLDAAMGSLSAIDTIQKIYGRLQVFALFKGYEDAISNDVVDSEIGSITSLFNTDENGSIDIKQLDPISPNPVADILRLHASNFATSTQMNPSSFNVQPSNGSFSSDTLIIQGKPFGDLVARCRSTYGDFIKRLAVISMSLFIEPKEDNDLNNLVPVFIDTFDREGIGKLGDGLQKIQDLIPDSNFGATNFIRQQLGIPIRDELLNIAYPAGFNSSKLKSQAEALKHEFFNEDGTLNVSNKETPSV